MKSSLSFFHTPWDISNHIQVFFTQTRERLFKYYSTQRSRLKQSYTNGPYLQILIVLTIIGLILRLYHMGDVSLWLDEVTALHRSQQSFLEIWENPWGDINPPLFFLIEHVMLTLGNSEFVLRLAPALIGTLTIPVIYGVGSEFYDRNIGVITAALLTFSVFHIWYSQEARPYSLLLFLLLVALLFYFKALRTDRSLYWLLTGLFIGLACWAHNSAIIIIPPLLMWLCISRFRQPFYDTIIRPLILASVTFLLAVAPFIPYLFGSYSGKINEPLTWGMQGLELLQAMGMQFFGGIGSPVLIMVYLFAVLFFLGLVLLLRTDRRKFKFLLITIIVLLATAWGLSYTMPTDPRYFIILFAFILLGISFAFLPFKKFFSPTRFLCYAIICIAVISIPSLHSYYSLDAKWEDWKGISREIEEVTDEGNIIIIVPPWSVQPFRYYYDTTLHNRSVYTVDYADELVPIVASHPDERIFFICSENSIGPYKWIAGNATQIGEYGEHHIYKLNVMPDLPSLPPGNDNGSTITVIVPNGGENWQQRSTNTIRWNYTGTPGAEVRIELIEKEAVYGVVTHNTSVGVHGSGSCNVTVPLTMRLGKDYRIRVISIENPLSADTSDAPFSISSR